MKPSRLILGVLVLLGAGYALWSFRAPGDSVAAVVVAKTLTVAPVAPKPIVPSIAAPVLAAAPKPALSVASAATPDVTNPQPQAGLDVCVAQTLKIVEAKDYLGLVKAAETPDVISSGRAAALEARAAQVSQMRGFAQLMTGLQQKLESIQGQMPELNADGTRATYNLDPSPGSNAPNGADGGDVFFVKADGNWYFGGIEGK